MSYSGLFVFTDQILNDLGILYQSSSWIIVSRSRARHRASHSLTTLQTAYSVTFAAFLLFWGRVSDLYSAKPVFVYGFAGLGV